MGQAVYLCGFVGKVCHGLSHAVVGCDTAATGTQQLKLAFAWHSRPILVVLGRLNGRAARSLIIGGDGDRDSPLQVGGELPSI